jgi:hypothetical protein
MFRGKLIGMQIHFINVGRFRRLSIGRDKPQNIDDHFGTRCSSCVIPDFTKLMYARIQSNIELFSQSDLSPERRQTTHHNVIVNQIIVSHMGAHEKGFMMPDFRNTPLLCSCVNPRVFANNIVIVDTRASVAIKIASAILFHHPDFTSINKSK